MGWNDQIIEEFRANHGVVGGRFEGATILLLHTTGAKTGQERIAPLLTLANGDGYLVVASKGGAPHHPHWYLNLLANPEVTVEVGTETFDATATPLTEPARREAFDRFKQHRAFFADYEKNAERVIPVVALARKS